MSKLGILNPGKGAENLDANLREIHEKLVSDIRAQYHQNGDLLIDVTRKVFAELEPEFEKRWAAKREVAKDAHDWEEPRKT
jgi:hypothetical protein